MKQTGGKVTSELCEVVIGACVIEDKPMTFSGDSYVHWQLTVSIEKRLNVQLELRTVQTRGRLMHAVGRVDYSILEVTELDLCTCC